MRLPGLRLLHSSMLAVALLAGAGGMAGCASQNTLQSFYGLERSLAGLSEKSVQVGDHRWVYAEGGSGETVVLLHGFAASKEVWMRMVREMPAGYHYVIPDLPGFGKSSYLPHADYDVPSQIPRMEAFFNQLGLTRFHLLGNSMGGNLATLYSATHPDQVATLALFAPSGVTQPLPSPYTKAYQEQGQAKLLPESREQYRQLLQDVFVEPPYAPDFIIDSLADGMMTRHAEYLRMYKQFWSRRQPLEPLLPEIRIPALILWGDQDKVLDVSAAQIFKQGLPHAQLVIWPNVGHAPMLEKSAEAAQLYSDFLARNRMSQVARLQSP